ncbi:uncharacterized protein LOC122027062 isoform X3 [Zingiber officinale]|uniref:uncharacterized protein LOC122027062 isoform X3 n=1 Tax=Zingiber officinale TaxID=94328 RepID=UPI001C4D0CDF|nr:uncharacterized protein LOC122027062 isoform X3 [Zingiber officinale]
MQKERSWMYKKNLPERRGLTDEFIIGLKQFLDFASSNVEFMDGKKLRCPCRKCHNGKFLQSNQVEEHLCRFGFTPNYYNWTCHGEPFISYEDYGRNTQVSVNGDQSYNYEQLNPYHRMVIDVADQNFIPESSIASSSFPPTFEQMFTSYASPLEEVTPPAIDENANNAPYLQFQEVLSAANKPLWAGCTSHTKLSFTIKLLNIKAKHNVSEDCFNAIVQVFGEALPRDHIMPNDFCSMKKLMKDLGLPMERIDVSRDDCMLYWGDDEDANVVNSVIKLGTRAPRGEGEGEGLLRKMLTHGNSHRNRKRGSSRKRRGTT